MLFSKNTLHINYLLVLIFLVLINNNSVSAKTKRHTKLTLANISYTPEFVTVREQNKVLVSVMVDSNYKGDLNKQLLLEQKKRLNGYDFFKPVAKLRDDGKNGDAFAGDSIYSAHVSFFQKITRNITLRVVAIKRHHRKRFVSDIFTLPVKNSCGPTGTILPVNIITIDSGSSNNKIIQFEVPGSTATPREIILRTINGAQIDSPISRRISRAVITLNDKRVIKLRKSNNISETPVTLKRGLNILKINHVRGKTDQSMAVDIKACADQISLTPISDTLLAGSEPLPAIAKITALGMPVENAKVNFIVNENLAFENQKSATSIANGSAQTSFVLTDEGFGQLEAIVEDAKPELLANIPIHSVNKASILVNQGFQSLTLAPGDDEKLPFFLFYLAKNPSQQHLLFDYKIEPDNGGLLISGGKSPGAGFLLTEPNSFELEPIITAINPGDYTLTAQASILETEESISTTTNVHVVKPGTPEPLIINQPGFTPSGIVPDTLTTVTVRAFIHGTSNPPDHLWLDEVDADGTLLNSEVAELNDAGNNGDNIAGDFIYTSQLEFFKSNSQELFFSVRADYFGQEVISSPAILSITPFSLEGPSPDPNLLVEGTSSDSQIFANELLIQLVIGTKPTRAETIAKSVGGKIVSIIPDLQLYRIQFNGDDTFQSVQQAISIISGFSEVILATENAEVTIASTTCNWHASKNCPQDPKYKDGTQWHLRKIRAKEAWNLAKANITTGFDFAGSEAFTVAVIDLNFDLTHADLKDQFLSDSKSNNESNKNHGTKVTSIIAANANTKDGIGVAWNTKIQSFTVRINSFDLDKAITDAAKSNVKIMNISLSDSRTENNKDLEKAVCEAVKAGKLMVIASGNPLKGGARDYYPAQFNNEAITCVKGTKELASHILAIGGSDDNDKLAEWEVTTEDITTTFNSNPVNWIDLYAPGEDINIFLLGDKSGTSFAAPQVAGAAAVLWPLMPSGTDAATIHNRLLESAETIGNIAGYGKEKRLNLLNAIPQVNVITINFVSASTAYNNIFGMYHRESREAKILIENINLNSNEPDLGNFKRTLYLSNEELDNLEFFLIPNGASQSVNQNYLQNTDAEERKLKVFKDDGIYKLKDITKKTILTGTDAAAFFTDSDLNPQENEQVIKQKNTNNNYTRLEWEDLVIDSPVFSDKDFNDAIFDIIIQQFGDL